MLEKLMAEAGRIGKPAWRPMLRYVAELHARSTHPPRIPFPYPWEEIGPGYCYGPAFGHWDIVHAVLDAIPSEPEHARFQLLNNLVLQQDDGLIPGSIWLGEEEPRWNEKASHPSVWPVAVQDYVETTGDRTMLAACFDALRRLIVWYEKNRSAEGEGFFYTDILNRCWESGVDEGVRFDRSPSGRLACVDATSHLYWLYEYAYRWSEQLGKEEPSYLQRAEALAAFIQESLYDERAGFFYDSWSVDRPKTRAEAFEGIWPVVVGAASPEQANRTIDGYLLNERKLFTAHPLATVAASDPAFELRMWRGPAWNSMTYWAARGCILYGRGDAAVRLLERALDASARQYEETGTVWEYYHPHGGSPLELKRKPHTEYNTPCRDYLGHNPLIAMARLWEEHAGR